MVQYSKEATTVNFETYILRGTGVVKPLQLPLNDAAFSGILVVWLLAFEARSTRFIRGWGLRLL